MSERIDIYDDYNKSGAIAVHAIFTASTVGERALKFLEEIFCSPEFDSNNPSERALFEQGQASVISKIKGMIILADKNFYEDNK